MNKIEDFKISNCGELYEYCGDINEKHIVVPDNVSFIKSNAFKNINMEKVTLPEYIFDIESEAFNNCPFLTTINFPENLGTFSSNTFNNCPKLEEIIIDKNDPVFKFKNGLFINKLDNTLCFCSPTCEDDPKIPNSITRIQEHAFNNCSKIKTLKLPNDLNKLSENSLYGLTSLENLILPSSLSYIDDEELLKLSNLKNIEFIESEYKHKNEFSIIENAIYSRKGDYLYAVIPNLGSTLNISPNITSIDRYIFKNLRNIRTIKFPNELDFKKILDWQEFNNEGLFATALDLEEIIFENRKNKIRYEWFYNTELNDIDFDEQLSKERFYKFLTNFFPSQLDSELKKISLEKVTSLISSDNTVSDEWKEAWSSYLKTQRSKYFELLPNSPNLLKFYLDNKYLSIKDTNEIVDLFKDANQTEFITKILNYQNENFSLEDKMKQFEKSIVAKPSTAAYLRNNFSYKIKEDGTVKITGYKGTEKIVSIPSMIAGHVVTEIGEKAFSPFNKRVDENTKNARNKIETIIFSDTITDVGYAAFSGCNSLTSVEFKPNMNFFFDNTEYKKDNELGIFSECQKLEKIIIPEGVTYIGESFFCFSYALREVEFPSTLKIVDKFSFWGCPLLTNIKVPNSVYLIKNKTFNRRLNLVEGEKGSYAEKYAYQYGFPFKAI